MKYLSLILIGIAILFTACIEGELVPNLTDCVCTDEYDPVCGADGWVYSNSCYAACAGVAVLDSSYCTEANPNVSDTLSWPLVEFCFPVAIPEHPKLVYTLSDGTGVYINDDSTYFRGRQTFLCRCLPPSSLIETPNGKVAIKDLKEGDEVWTMTADGQKVAESILIKNRVPVDSEHQVLFATLVDGREILMSPLHPDQYGRPMQSLTIGDEVDGSKISCMELIDYQGIETMDILPGGKTGVYWVNGVLVGSTLKGLSFL